MALHLTRLTIAFLVVLLGLSACGKSEPSQKAQENIPDAPAKAPPLPENPSASSQDAVPEIKFALVCLPGNGKGNRYYMVSMGRAASLLTSSPSDRPEMYTEYALILEQESTEEYRYGSVGASDEAKAYGSNPYILNRQDLVLTSVGVGSLNGLKWTFNCQMAQDKVAILEMIKTKRNEYRAYKKQQDLQSQQEEEQKKRNTKI
ncbi:hypothetical protein [Polynucleobacter sp. AP-Titi-500A-B4]|uniref:hypothetical protein n=1 Tax=Polynucleobacter sp. AP-Titi-500A-B4 TaxID=2576923 RepID=UPI001BFD1EBE|nr:hypothetical protein [Polynucleobacter sp. AP-Titi-500A-B4]QWE12489.1 hypothetical protein FD968_10375 [Polynucleobacter sp. AP-Titi-500A-B4]